ncbi:hypothetical protein N658DRAFT_486193 [Parathielavia hyrcaniae]|uniref:Rhodopsin domain-containing protein n=1 Tax=Parathielavia hyrcaniae TaxID=113614 RepID=A0AAN6T111_9PEZI|nr:hypothetical protein N658DRAFT_486193 [Parathielavia hyrcaniae]
MGLYSSPPPARPFSEDKATLLTSWWITAMCAVVIILRLIGRYIRVEMLFVEDRIAALALIPLLLRMAFVHPILVYGTNNVLLDDPLQLSSTKIDHRSIASRLVLVSRILHPAVLWVLKVVTLEFFNRLFGHTGKRRYTLLLRLSRAFLAATFLAIIIADLAECQPVARYWQVVPDPGGSCRQGYAHLLASTACNVATDLLLVALPVPIVVRSRLSPGRKALLVLLFGLHLLTVAVAVYRVPDILREGGYQPTRTMWASAEILVATFAANALTIGTFVRDTGAKKKKFRYQRQSDSGLRSAKRESRTGTAAGRKVSWNDPDSDGEGEGEGEGAAADQRLRKGGGTQEGSKHGVIVTNINSDAGRPQPQTDRRGGSISRTESQDSLIPRGRYNTPATEEGGVMKTTTVNITVSQVAEPGYSCTAEAAGLMLRPADGVVTASARGRARGATIPLRELEPLSQPGAGAQGLKAEHGT